MKAYATSADLGAWLDPDADTPDTVADAYVAQFGDQTAARVLARASEVVEEHCLTGYTATADGLPTDTDVAAWLRDAACAQVEFWGLVSEQHDIGGVTSGQMSAGGVTHNMPGVLAPRARRLLDLAGLRSPIGGCRAYRTPLELIGRVYPQ